MQLSSPTVLISPEEATVVGLPVRLYRHFNTMRKHEGEIHSSGCCYESMEYKSNQAQHVEYLP